MNSPIGDNSPRSIKKSNAIVGASVTKPVSEPNNGAIKKTAETKIAALKSSSLAPSDEFRTFWGNNVDPMWFEGRRFGSPFLLFIVILICLIFYLCSNLLFSPGEIQQIFSEPLTPISAEPVSEPLIDHKEENLLLSPDNQNSKTEKTQQKNSKATNKNKP